MLVPRARRRADCYRAEMPDPWLLHRAFDGVERISARMSATRRRPVHRPPADAQPAPSEGGIGAFRVEARGNDDAGGHAAHIVGIAELIGTAAAAVAAAFIDLVIAGDAPPGVVTSSDASLPTDELLGAVVHGGVRLQAFTGIPHTG